MKILVVQLARLGDIFLTWPVLSALRRQNPTAEIHFLVRKRFAEAAPDDGRVSKLHILDSREILSPLIDEKPDFANTLGRLDQLLGELREEQYDRIINLSFSPLSSFLTKSISSSSTQVAGYTRQEDGYLAIPDDASAYFYSQTGFGLGNRLHVTELFAQVADVDLFSEDWGAGLESARTGLIVHPAASQNGKTFSTGKWAKIIRGLLQRQAETVTLIGSEDEVEASRLLVDLVGEQPALRNQVGCWSLKQTQHAISQARLLVGGDSSPVHMASLTATPVLNLSFGEVRFWETGPKSAGSRILPAVHGDDLASDMIVEQAISMLVHSEQQIGVKVPGLLQTYIELQPAPDAFAWAFLQALYMGQGFPPVPNAEFLLGMEKMVEANVAALAQMQLLESRPGNAEVMRVLQSLDDAVDAIQELVPELGPLVRWFQTEKLRLPPMPFAELLQATLDIHWRLLAVCEVYVPHQVKQSLGAAQAV